MCSSRSPRTRTKFRSQLEYLRHSGNYSPKIIIRKPSPNSEFETNGPLHRHAVLVESVPHTPRGFGLGGPPSPTPSFAPCSRLTDGLVHNGYGQYVASTHTHTCYGHKMLQAHTCKYAVDIRRCKHTHMHTCYGHKMLQVQAHICTHAVDTWHTRTLLFFKRTWGGRGGGVSRVG